jgi:photosystem I subunit 11
MVKKNVISPYMSSDFQIIKSFQNDPFVGHLSTPITSSNLISTYLSTLSIYKKSSSSFLSGLNIGVIHGYFLLGPFFLLGPLRNSEYSIFLSFLSSIALITILSLALFIYKIASFTSINEKTLKSFLSNSEWNQIIQGFYLGGFIGVTIGTFFISYFFN